MSSAVKSFLLVVWVTLFFLPVRGQDRTARFRHLTIEDGLPQNMVDCMLQDYQGFMWFGTWNGLCRYDGYSFEVFNSEMAGPNALKNNFIYSLKEDRYHNIWIGTREGLQVFLYDRSVFLTTRELMEVEPDWLRADIRSMEIWKDSILLVGTGQGLGALVIRNTADGLRLSTVTMGQDLFQESINALMTDSRGNIWAGTDHGAVCIAPDGNASRFRFEPDNVRSLTTDRVLSVFESSDGTVWIGTDLGFNRLDLQGRMQRFYHLTGNSNSLIHNTVMDIEESASGDLLLATLGGFSVMSIADMTFTNYVNEHNVAHSLSNDFVNCLVKDRHGNVWLGTERGGVNFYNTGQNRFEHFEYRAANPQSLSHSTVNSVYEDEQYVWIGTAGGGLNRYTKRTGRFKHYRQDAGNSLSLSGDFVTSIQRDDQGRLWVGTWGNGLNQLLHEGQSDEGFRHYLVASHPGLNSNFISAFEKDSQGHLWIATLGALTKLDPEKEIFTPQLNHEGTFKVSEAGCLLFDQENSLWVGTRKGLFHLDLSVVPYGVTKFLNDPENPASLSSNYVISILEDSGGNLWFGTYGKGLNRMHAGRDSVWFESFSTAQGLSNTVIYGIEEDAYGDLWLSTDYGLSRFTPKTQDFRNFYVSDGLVNNQYYWSSSYKNEQGKLYFGGMNGLDAFYPEWIGDEETSPLLVITDIRLLNESVVPGHAYNGVEVLTGNLYEAREIHLSYKEKILGIEFSSLHYLEPGMIRYAYILEGFEDDWNYVSSDRRYAGYTNLKPGEYTFRVKAAGVNGDFDHPERTLRIVIAPPFWETPWFQVLIVMAGIGLFYGYVRWRTYTLKQQKIHLERQVAERTERINQQKEALKMQAEQLQRSNHDLEEKKEFIEGQNHQLELQNREIAGQRDELIKLNRKLNLVSQLKLSFFTNISHEFRTPLTLIIGPLERLLQGHRLDAEVKQTLGLMSRNAQRLLHLINQIMDFRKIEKGRMELRVGKSNFPAFCQSIFEAFQPLAEVKRIRFEYVQKEVPHEVWLDAERIENILYNLLSNAFKYTPEGGNIRVIIQGITGEESQIMAESHGESKTVLSVKVVDSGIGISNENLPLVFKRFYRIESEEAFKIGGSGIGLALAEELIKSHHGEIFVESVLGEGSSFEIQFPCLRGAYASYEITRESRDEAAIHRQVELLKGEFLACQDPEMLADEPVVSDPSKQTLLVVEDNHDLRKFLAFQLGKTFNVLEAKDGMEGYYLAQKSNPDLVVSDVMMPKTDGLELCARLKNDLHTSHIPVILLTAKSTVENQIEGLQIGADDYLAKPFNLDLLLAKIRNLIGSRKKLKQLFAGSAPVKAAEMTPNLKDQKFLEQTFGIVENHLQDSSFGPRELVKELGVSRSLLHKKLTALTGQSAADFINQMRMKKACHLLRTSEMNVSEVAYAVGYNDPKYFSRLFSKYFGQSPKDYLKETVC